MYYLDIGVGPAASALSFIVPPGNLAAQFIGRPPINLKLAGGSRGVANYARSSCSQWLCSMIRT